MPPGMGQPQVPWEACARASPFVDSLLFQLIWESGKREPLPMATGGGKHVSLHTYTQTFPPLHTVEEMFLLVNQQQEARFNGWAQHPSHASQLP